jgi:isopentenyldiphosphate isomerase
MWSGLTEHAQVLVTSGVELGFSKKSEVHVQDLPALKAAFGCLCKE